jgi:hypothetical protein
MKLETILEIYELISCGVENISTRKEIISIRKRAFNSVIPNNLIKNAFDTRRVNQETEYNPRRGLQNYHRSEPFVSEGMGKKIKAFSKLSSILDKIKSEYGHEPEWQDSYVRVLSSSIHKGLRTIQADGDFSEAQPSVGSLDYLEELMFVRYRLTAEDLVNMSEENIKKAVLSRDELLVNGGISYISSSPITIQDVGIHSYDHMVDKMLNSMAQIMSQAKPVDTLTDKLFGVKATSGAPEVERTVTINIKDKIVNAIEKVSSPENDINVKTSENKV